MALENADIRALLFYNFLCPLRKVAINVLF